MKEATEALEALKAPVLELLRLVNEGRWDEVTRALLPGDGAHPPGGAKDRVGAVDRVLQRAAEAV